MPTVTLTLPHHAYDICVEPGALRSLGEWVRAVAPHGRAALLADANVLPLHGKAAQQSLEQAGYALTTAPVPPGEDHKHLQQVASLYEHLLSGRLERRSPVIALGGGVIGDTVGFVAATYLRGVPFVQCPTTLLSMVDASVGGKVGVNLARGKNLVGAFWQPVLVVCDTDTLRTLPPRELRCGLAECVKHGVIRDVKLFEWLEANLEAVLKLDSDAMVQLVRWNVQIKANVVMADEKETGERAHLNFGHTFAHAVEATSGYGHYEHGEAVSLGMVAATRLAVHAKRIDSEVLDRLVRLLDRIGLPTRAPDLAPTTTLIDAMRLDKKVAGGRVRLVLPDKLGAVSMVSDTPDDAIHAAWESLRA
ncbi:MAG: 3-dehydroquinate synthase [Phycisphaeraceae bacterium]